jgi:hypothetical protein
VSLIEGRESGIIHEVSLYISLQNVDQGVDKPVGWIPVKMTGSNCLRGLLPFELDAYDRTVVGKRALPRDRS